MKKIITIFLALFCFQAAFAQYRDDYADIKDKSYKELKSEYDYKDNIPVSISLPPTSANIALLRYFFAAS